MFLLFYLYYNKICECLNYLISAYEVPALICDGQLLEGLSAVDVEKVRISHLVKSCPFLIRERENFHTFGQGLPTVN